MNKIIKICGVGNRILLNDLVFVIVLLHIGKEWKVIGYNYNYLFH